MDPVCYCINLDDRPDKWAATEEAFQGSGLKIERFSGIRHAEGWKGCGASFESLKFPRTLQVSLSNIKATGQLLNRSKTIESPVISWSQPLDSYRTLVCVDPDASAPSWLHWLIVNCTGTSPDSGTEIVKWSPPSPPPNTGTHRYYFCLFTHTYKVNVETPKQLGYFNLEEFVKSNGLEPYSVATIKVAPST